MGAGAAPRCRPTALTQGFLHLLFAEGLVLKEENWAGTGAPGWVQGVEGDMSPPSSLSGGRWEPAGVLALAIHSLGPGQWKAVTKGGI